MVQWTDKIIQWNQLGSKEVRHLIKTWGTDLNAPAVPTVKKVSKVAKKVATVTVARQKHTGADGEVKYLSHRDLYIGFMGGKVVVTKRTKEACQEFLKTNFGAD